MCNCENSSRHVGLFIIYLIHVSSIDIIKYYMRELGESLFFIPEKTILCQMSFFQQWLCMKDSTIYSLKQTLVSNIKPYSFQLNYIDLCVWNKQVKIKLVVLLKTHFCRLIHHLTQNPVLISFVRNLHGLQNFIMLHYLYCCNLNSVNSTKPCIVFVKNTV